jgi:Bacterial regulatory proteins, luxR family
MWRDRSGAGARARRSILHGEIEPSPAHWSGDEHGLRRATPPGASRTPRLSSRRGQTPPPTPLRRDPPPALDLTNSEIAAARHVGEATVTTHVGSIFVKPGVRDRVAAIVRAIDHAWSPRERKGYLRGRTPVKWGTSGGGHRLCGVPPGADSD